MRINREIIYIRISAFVCAAILFLDAGVFPSFSGVTKKDILKNPEKALSAEAVITNTAAENAEEGEKSGQTALAAASDNVAVGEIQNRFISPYTANTSYNNVYLKNSTELDIDIKQLISEGLDIKIEKNAGPQVLIVHSHATECYMTEDRDYYTASDVSRSKDNEKNVVAVGEELAKKLNGAGIVTLHSETQHDNPDYNYSYTNCAKTVKEYLAQYPGIKIVLDMHRDAIGGNGAKVKVTTKINGKQAAQVMLVMGSQSGGRTDYPDYRENLKLAVRLQQTIEILYPGLARAVSLVPYEYNQSLHKGSMLIEMGTDANTLEEAKYSAQLVGDALISLCNTLN